MVGNDIVDLRDRDALAETLHPRFDERVFAPAERRVIVAQARRGGAALGARARWTLWAAKEAAYKLARQQLRESVFSPRRFVVTLATGASGSLRGAVRHPHGACRLRFVRDGAFVHALAEPASAVAGALLHGQARLSREAALDPMEPGRAVRAALCSEVAARIGLAAGGLRVERDAARVPRLLGASQPIEVSLSHHGRFIAWACRVPEAMLRASPAARRARPAAASASAGCA